MLPTNAPSGTNPDDLTIKLRVDGSEAVGLTGDFGVLILTPIPTAPGPQGVPA